MKPTMEQTKVTQTVMEKIGAALIALVAIAVFVTAMLLYAAPMTMVQAMQLGDDAGEVLPAASLFFSLSGGMDSAQPLVTTMEVEDGLPRLDGNGNDVIIPQVVTETAQGGISIRAIFPSEVKADSDHIFVITATVCITPENETVMGTGSAATLPGVRSILEGERGFYGVLRVPRSGQGYEFKEEDNPDFICGDTYCSALVRSEVSVWALRFKVHGLDPISVPVSVRSLNLPEGDVQKAEVVAMTKIIPAHLYAPLVQRRYTPPPVTKVLEYNSKDWYSVSMFRTYMEYPPRYTPPEDYFVAYSRFVPYADAVSLHPTNYIIEHFNELEGSASYVEEDLIGAGNWVYGHVAGYALPWYHTAITIPAHVVEAERPFTLTLEATWYATYEYHNWDRDNPMEHLIDDYMVAAPVLCLSIAEHHYPEGSLEEYKYQVDLPWEDEYRVSCVNVFQGLTVDSVYNDVHGEYTSVDYRSHISFVFDAEDLATLRRYATIHDNKAVVAFSLWAETEDGRGPRWIADYLYQYTKNLAERYYGQACEGLCEIREDIFPRSYYFKRLRYTYQP